MTAALTPAHALAYLALLSTDIQKAAVLDAEGGLLAGDERVAAAARAALASSEGVDVRAAAGDGAVYVSRSERHSVAVEVGRFALGSVVIDDLRRVLRELDRS
jgi:hypothetical protein